MANNKEQSFGGGVLKLLAILLSAAVLAVAGFVVVKGCGCVVVPEPSNYGEVGWGVRALVEAQSSYCVHKTRGRFANSMAELGFVRDGGEVMKEAVWNANFEKSDRKPYEGYFYTTFSLDNGKRAVALAVPANGKPPVFIALYGEIGVSMAKARGTSVYRTFDKTARSKDFLSGKTTVDEVRSIISKAERMPDAE